MTRHKWDLITDTCEKCGCMKKSSLASYKGGIMIIGSGITNLYSYDNGKTWDKNTGCKKN